jgi:PAS domain-containing protein
LEGVATRRHKHLALIIARELASQLATATFIADADGDLVFYNEAAEEILGRTYAEAGAMPASEWPSLFRVEAPDGTPLPLEKLPGGIALTEKRPAHARICIVGLDGERRLISVTAMPLFAHPTEVVGMVAFFWEEGDRHEDGDRP